jgi:ribonuclease-3
MNNIKKISQIISYNFRDESLLTESLTHTGKNRRKNSIFQRLEFLGDRVLGLCIAKILYDKFPSESEGDLTRRMHNLVNEETLAEIARMISLNEYLILSYNEEKTGGRDKSTILSDSLESLIAAIYIDGGFEEVFKFIKSNWGKYALTNKKPPIDPKTMLQEWCQSKGYDLPQYVELSRKGPDHNPEFTIKLIFGGNIEFEGIGQSKKQAERSAAINALKSDYVSKN